MFGNPEQTLTPLGNATNVQLSKLVMRMWASFAYDLDPNGHGGMYLSFEYRVVIDIIGVVAGIAEWPRYGENATNFVFRTDKSYIEEDTDRAEGIAYINSIVR